MPLYDVEHILPPNILTPSTQRLLAKELTQLHSARFKTPGAFVNVRYTDVSTIPTFRNGIPVSYNRILLRTRIGERTKETYDEHCFDIIRVWNEIFDTGSDEQQSHNNDKKKESDDNELAARKGQSTLRTVWIMPSLITAVECGIARPKVGEESGWLKAHLRDFKRLADEGEEDFVELVAKVELEAEDSQASRSRLRSLTIDETS